MLSHLSTAALWLGAIVVAVIPGAIALDSGGVLPWSYWAAAAAVLLPAALAVAAFRPATLPRGWQPHLLTLLLLAMGIYAYLQTISLPAGIVSWISPGAHAAWSEWLPEWARGESAAGGPQSQPVSVAPFRSLHHAAVFLTMAAFAWCGAMLFSTRGRITWLLSALAAFGAVHAVLGFWQVFMFPGISVWGADVGQPFGVFINRNNAAGLLNVSLAAGLGLLGWRLTAVTGHEFGENEFSFGAILDLLSDRASLVAMAAITICLAGLLACGSRGGLAGAVAGFALALGLLKSRRITRRLGTALALAFLIAFILLARADISPRTIERFGAGAEGISDSILSEGRLPHWADSLQAVRAYLPAGGGFGAYAYAYLPYQVNGGSSWYVNADNLWLEWLLEAGLVALVFAALGLYVLVYALLQLKNTPDPMDHGIATAGWYALGAMVVGQTFDFGLLLAGTAAATALLFGAVLGRAAMAGTPLGNSRIRFRPTTRAARARAPLQFQTSFRPYQAALVGVAVAAAASLAVAHLHRESLVDAAIRAAATADSSDEQSLLAARDALDRAARLDSQNADLDYQQARLQLRLARLAGAANLLQSGITNDPQQALQTSGLSNLRSMLAASQPSGGAPSPQDEALRQVAEQAFAAGREHYRQATEAATTALGKSPLAAEPRFLLLRLGYDPSSPHTAELYSQIATLRRNTAVTLSALARLAAEAEDWERATATWKRLLIQRPASTTAVLQVAAAAGHPQPTDVVPPVPEALRRGAEYAVASPTPDLAFIRRAIEPLSAVVPADRVQRAERYALLARLHLVLGESEQAVELYADAVRLSPTDLNHQIAYINALAEAGNVVAAIRVAEDARPLAGSSRPKIERLVEQLKKRLAAPAP